MDRPDGLFLAGSDLVSTHNTGAVLFPIILWSALTDPDEYLWTAHMADTTAKAFLELVGQDDDDESSLLRQCPWLAARVRTVVRTHGNEGVQFVNGASLGFRCRSAGRGRGLSGTGLVLDETLEVTPEQAAALLPVLATRSLHGNARVYYASSSAKRSSAYLRSVRRRAVAGDPTLTYVGWWARGSWAEPGCVQDGCMHAFGTEGCALDDEARWAEGNPLLGKFTSVDYLRGMRRQMDPVQFGVMMLINCALGLNTPPVGTTQFVGCAIGGISVGEVMRSIWPFYGALLACLMLVTYVPAFSLWLPNFILH